MMNAAELSDKHGGIANFVQLGDPADSAKALFIVAVTYPRYYCALSVASSC
jgi:hypothetical protein